MPAGLLLVSLWRICVNVANEYTHLVTTTSSRCSRSSSYSSISSSSSCCYLCALVPVSPFAHLIPDINVTVHLERS